MVTQINSAHFGAGFPFSELALAVNFPACHTAKIFRLIIYLSLQEVGLLELVGLSEQEMKKLPQQ